MKRIPLLLLSLTLPTIAAAARAQNAGENRYEALMNLDGPSALERGAVGGYLNSRFFNAPEQIAYTGFGFRYGLLERLEVGVRGDTGSTRTLALPGGGAIRHGGSAAEFYGKYNFGSVGEFRIALAGGLILPDTPAQNQAAGTVSGSAAIKLLDSVTFTVNPRAVFMKDNSIVGIGGGVTVRLAERFHLVGDWTTIVSGDNTRDTTSGDRKRGDVWGAALRFSSAGTGPIFDFDIGYGSGIGATTGSSLTPGLGNSSAFYIALRARH